MGFFSNLFGGDGSYKTVEVTGETQPSFGESVTIKRIKAINEMEKQGYVLVDETVSQNARNNFLEGFHSFDNSANLTYILTFKKVK